MPATQVQSANFFVTDTGIEVLAVTADQMRELDRIATEETGPNLFQMMENAGRNLAWLAMQVLGKGCESSKVLVLAGSGGNGSGGICAARHLANHGVYAELCLAEPERLSEIAQWQRKIFRSSGGVEVDRAELNSHHPDLIIDALIGYGLSWAPREPVAQLIHWANSRPTPVISLDLPSGLDATTGQAPGAVIHAGWTLTLALPKTGLDRTENLSLGDVGIPAEAYRRLGLDFVSPFGRAYVVSLQRAFVTSRAA